MIRVDKITRFEHQVTVAVATSLEIHHIETWCYDQFGARFSIVERDSFPNQRRDGVWHCMYTKSRHGEPELRSLAEYEFRFDHIEDAVLFALRWL